VRFARAWKGAAVGLTAGGIAALIWTVLDFTARIYAEWPQLLTLAGACAVAGALAGFFWKLASSQVAASIDRRANLKDRLATALEEKRQVSAFAEAQEDDARHSLSDVRPREIYPMKVSRWHLSGLGFTLASVGLFALLSSNILLNSDQQKAKQEAEKLAAAIERIAKPLEEKKPADSAAAKAQEKLAKDMKLLARDLKKARLTKEEALQKANELAKQAKKLGQERVAKAEQDMLTARDQLTKMELDKNGIDPDTLEKLSLSKEQKKLLNEMMQKEGLGEGEKGKFDQKSLDQMGLNELSADMMNMTSEELQKMEDAMSKELSDLESKAAKGQLSEAEKKRMEQLKKLMESLKLSEAAKAGLKELMNSDVAKELQKLLSQMEMAQQKAEDGQPLSDQDLEDMKKAMEDLAKKLEDPAFRQAMKDAMEQMLQDIKDGKMSLSQGQGLLGLLGLQIPNMPGPGGPGNQYEFPDTGKINKSDGLKTSGEGLPISVRGQRDDKRGTETYIEIKAPTAPGARSSVPYNKVLPKYTDRAEKDLGKQKVPKKHEERVKNYFDSLNGGGK
jgi:hypothetical protein